MSDDDDAAAAATGGGEEDLLSPPQVKEAEEGENNDGDDDDINEEEEDEDANHHPDEDEDNDDDGGGLDYDEKNDDDDDDEGNDDDDGDDNDDGDDYKEPKQEDDDDDDEAPTSSTSGKKKRKKSSKRKADGSSSRKKKKKRRRKDDDDDQDDDDDEEEEEDEEEVRRARARAIRRYIDAAAVDEDDDEDEQEAELEEELELAERDKKMFLEDDDDGDDDVDLDDRAVHLQDWQKLALSEHEIDRLHREEEEREIRMRLEEKAGAMNLEAPNARRAKMAAAAAIDGRQVDEPELLPAVSDPKLFLVPCKVGKEMNCVIALMRKFVQRARSGEPFFIHSAFTTPASKGFVYVEADKQVHVERAARGISDLYNFKMSLVPIQEQVQAISFKAQRYQLAVGSWVRLKRGVYKDDLARVEYLEDQGTRVTVRFVPRIDMALLKHYVKVRDDGEEDQSVLDGIAKRLKNPPMAGGRERPLQRLFNPQEVQAMGVEVGREPERSLWYDVLRVTDQRFRNGFMYQTLNASALNTDIQPLPDELEKFRSKLSTGAGNDDDDDMDEHNADEAAKEDREIRDAIARASRRQVHYVRGDNVVVSSGLQKGVTGCVSEVKNNGDFLVIKPYEYPAKPMIEVEARAVQKLYFVGMHVKCVGGPHAGETGVVVALEGSERVVLFTDVTSEEVRCLQRDVIESTEVNPGRDTLGQYALHDLVQLGEDVVGVIVKIETNSCKVLTNRGVLETVQPRDIQRKRDSRFASALDANQNTMQQGDIVTVIDGLNKGVSGEVKHVYRSTIFIYNREQVANAGIFLGLSRRCRKTSNVNNSLAAAGGGGGGFPASLQSPSMNQSMAQRLSGFHPRGQHARGGFHQQRDPLMGKEVMIGKGIYKGYKGEVRGVTGDAYRILLSDPYKTVTVKRSPEYVRLVSDVESGATGAGGYGAGMGGDTPMLGSQTPMMFAQTPRLDYGGSRTPFGAQTPRFDGSATPRTGDDAWAPSTPYIGRETPGTHTWRPETPHLGGNQSSLGAGTSSVMHTPSGAGVTGGTVGDVHGYGEAGGTLESMNMMPNTPAPNVQTPYGNMFTPAPASTPDAYNMPMTYHTPNTPFTPAAPHTPGMPHTPHTPGMPQTPAAPQGSWVMRGMLAIYENLEVVILDNEPTNEGTVRVDTQSGTDIYVPVSSLQPKRPSGIHQSVVVLAPGPRYGSKGTMIGIDEHEGMVSMANSDDDFLIFNLTDLVCMHSQ